MGLRVRSEVGQGLRDRPERTLRHGHHAHRGCMAGLGETLSGLGFKVEGLGFGVQGFGLRV